MIETNTMLTEALVQALETMAFLTNLPLEADGVAPESAVLAQIGFTGPKTGTIQILAGMDFAKVLAENIGALEGVDDETAFDAMKELSNVTCGLLLPMIGSSPADVFDMTIPTIQSGQASPGWDEFTAREDCRLLNIEDFLVAARLTMKE
ncbi:MAG: chemotaxis protein CheX [Phycisphaerales bacterium]|nr:MAG: chemotaxis protein CheX [Phycisphaerales bacterium]